MIIRKIHAVYGKNAEKKITDRKRLLMCLPIIAFCILLMLYCLGCNFLQSVLYGLLGAVGVFALCDYDIIRLAKRKSRMIKLELADFMDRLAIMLEAGISVWNALAMVTELLPGDSFLGDEMRQTVRMFSMADGYYYDPESALDDLSKRCDDVSVSTFSALLVQNARKGTDELTGILRMQAINARTERKAIAKQLADEASSLMVIPSVIILVAVLLLAAAPAVIGFL